MNSKLDSIKTFLILAMVLFASVGIGILTVDSKEEPTTDIWIPTEEDIQYQDSMWNIIEDTRRSVDTIRSVMDNIIWKLERLEYEDGSWDSIRYRKGGVIDRRRNVIEYDFDMECGDTIDVSATMYYPVVGQCDDTPDITADQTKIPDIYDCSYLRWIEVSQDLLWFNGGPIRYGDTVYVYAGHKTGAYIVRDAMNKRFKNKIDFLESVGTDLYSFDEAKLIINS